MSTLAIAVGTSHAKDKLVNNAQIYYKECNNIPTMKFFTGISRNTWSKSYTLSLTECVWEFQNIASWDTQ